MKKQSVLVKATSLMLAASVLLTSCVSTTLIQSVPSGAKVYLNGEPVGVTPYTHSDTKIVGTTTMVKLTMDGYDPLNTSFSRAEEVDPGAIICGFIAFFPFLWTMKYKSTHTYELTPSTGGAQPVLKAPPAQSKSERLKELKQLLEDKLITPEDYEKRKQKILDEY